MKYITIKASISGKEEHIAIRAKNKQDARNYAMIKLTKLYPLATIEILN